MELSQYKQVMKNPKMLFCILGKRKLLKWLPDRLYIKMAYFFEMGRLLNLTNPTTYSEKIQWVKLYDRKELYPILVDKVAVRAFVHEKVKN